MLELLEKRVGPSEGGTVVVDRGMSVPENIAELRRRKLHYLVAASQKERDVYLAEFEAGDGFEEVIRQPAASFSERGWSTAGTGFTRRPVRLTRSLPCPPSTGTISAGSPPSNGVPRGRNSFTSRATLPWRLIRRTQDAATPGGWREPSWAIATVPSGTSRRICGPAPSKRNVRSDANELAGCGKGSQSNRFSLLKFSSD